MGFWKYLALAGFLVAADFCLVHLIFDRPKQTSSSELASRNPAQALTCSDLFDDVTPAIDPLAKIRQTAIGGLFHRPPKSLTESEWYMRTDENSRVWVTGTSHLARGVTEVYVRTPERISEAESFLLLLENFRNNGLDMIHPGKAGLAITLDSAPVKSETYQVISLKSLNKPQVRNETLEAQENLPEDFFNFVFNGYRQRMEIDDHTIDRLREISRQVEDRTLLFVKTKEAYVEMRQDSGEFVFMQDRRKIPADPLLAARVMGRLMPEHFTLEAGMSVVKSRNAQEKLPLELFTGFEIPRTDAGTIVEVGRFFVDKPGAEDAATSGRIIGVLATMLQRQDISKMIIEADAARARLFARYGFKPIHKRTNFAARTEYIMEASPTVVAENALRMLMEQIDSSSPLPRTMSSPQKIPFYDAYQRYLNPDSSQSHATSWGGGYDIEAVMSTIRDLAVSPYPKAIKQRGIELILADARELNNLSFEDKKKLAAFLLKRSPVSKSLREDFIAWFEHANQHHILALIYPHIRVREYCNTKLKDLRDTLWSQRTPKKEAVEILSQAIRENFYLINTFKPAEIRKFALMLLDPKLKDRTPFDLSLEVIKGILFLDYGKPL